MGKSFRLHCDKCGWHEDIYTGTGAGDRRYADDALIALQTGPYGEQAFECLLNNADVGVGFERALYRCRYCGKLQMRLTTALHVNGDTFVQAYYCDYCGKMMTKQRQSAFKALPCPQCGETLALERGDDWEIAPVPEFRSAPMELVNNIIPVAVNCFRRETAEGSEYVAVKSEEQLARLSAGKAFPVETYSSLDEARAGYNAYMVFYCPSGETIWLTCPISSLAVDDAMLSELHAQLTELYNEQSGVKSPVEDPIKLCFISGEPFMCVTMEGCVGLLTRGLWSSPLLQNYSSSIEHMLTGTRSRR